MPRRTKMHLAMPKVEGMPNTVCSRKMDNRRVTHLIQHVSCTQCQLWYNYNKAQWIRIWNDAYKRMTAWGIKFYEERLMTPNQFRLGVGLPRLCKNDQKPILVMAYQGEEYCSEGCRKDLASRS